MHDHSHAHHHDHTHSHDGAAPTHAEAVDADSIMELLMLAAGPGTELTLETRGPDAEAAADALEALVAAGFYETD